MDFLGLTPFWQGFVTAAVLFGIGWLSWFLAPLGGPEFGPPRARGSNPPPTYPKPAPPPNPPEPYMPRHGGHTPWRNPPPPRCRWPNCGCVPSIGCEADDPPRRGVR